jgi:translation initiation factor 2 alpha subunit (eIF-2alpha)
MTQIGLSKDQESRIRAIRKMARKKQILISNQIISSPDRNNQFKSLKRLTKQQINEVLSNSQKEKLKSLEKQ